VNPILSIREIAVQGGERDTLSEAAVTLRTVVTFVTCLISRTEFLVSEVFYNAILCKIQHGLSRTIESEVRRGVLCFNESTFVTDDLAQCLCNVLFIMRCAFGVHVDVGLAERPTTSRFIGTVHVSLSSFQGRWLSFDKTDSLE